MMSFPASVFPLTPSFSASLFPHRLLLGKCLFLPSFVLLLLPLLIVFIFSQFNMTVVRVFGYLHEVATPFGRRTMCGRCAPFVLLPDTWALIGRSIPSPTNKP